MKWRKALQLTATVFGLVGANPGSSVAANRMRLDGNVCVPTSYGSSGSGAPWSIAVPWVDGLRIAPTVANQGALCAIPTGPSLVDLGDGSHPLTQVNAWVHHSGTATIQGEIILHDLDHASSCSCGSATNTTNNNHKWLAMNFDCGSCQYDTNWPVLAHVKNVSGGGVLTIKRIAVQDDN